MGMRFALPLLLLLAAQDPAGTPLRYDFSLNLDMDFGGLPVQNALGLGLAMEPADPDEKGVSEIKVAVDRVKLEMHGVFETEYDSDVDVDLPDDAIGRFIAGLEGQSFSMKLNRRGEVLEVAGADEMIKAAAKNLERGGGIGKQLKKLFANEQLKRMLQQAIPVLPEKPAAKGSSWESKFAWAFPGLGTLTMKHTTTLKELREEGKEADLQQ